jgi:hypothetical protein
MLMEMIGLDGEEGINLLTHSEQTNIVNSYFPL